jgi:hypothetical protein
MGESAGALSSASCSLCEAGKYGTGSGWHLQDDLLRPQRARTVVQGQNLALIVCNHPNFKNILYLIDILRMFKELYLHLYEENSVLLLLLTTTHYRTYFDTKKIGVFVLVKQMFEYLFLFLYHHDIENARSF